MKSYLLGLMFIGLANLTFSQNQIAYNSSNIDPLLETKSSSVKTPLENKLSKRITKFQKKAANYDITRQSIYQPNTSRTYTVIFKEANNSIENTYDKNGVLIQSNQSYSKIKLPYSISSKLAKANPGWAIDDVHCTINFKANEATVISYEVKLKNDKETKTVTITQ
jgi:hypothetical protein